MVLKKYAVILIGAFIMCTALAACGGPDKDISDVNPTNEKTISSAQTSTPDKKVFKLYKKVSLGMTKDQVDSALGVAGKAETGGFSLTGTYNYKDENNKYGVCVVYNDKNVVYSKTVLYDTSKAIAPMFKNSVFKSTCDKIKHGMTYSKVKDIIGEDGVECSITALPNDISKPGVIRRWVNKDGSGLQIVFLNDDTVGNAHFYNGF